MRWSLLALPLVPLAASLSLPPPQAQQPLGQLDLAPPGSRPDGQQQPTDVLTPALDGRIERILAEWEIPGAGVAVVRRTQEGWKVETKGYGWADVQAKRKVDADTRFSIASNTKQFTAIAAGLVLSNASVAGGLPTPDAGRGGWEKHNLKDVVPGWGLADGWAQQEADLSDVLSHRSGLPRHDLVRARQDISELVESVRHLRPSVSFRDKYQYCNLPFMIAGFLPQFHLNTTFAAYLDRFLFAPLGMDATGLSITAAQASGHMAVGHTREDVSAYRPLGTRRAMFPHLERDEGAVNWGAGGIIMSVRDAARWLQTLLGDGRHPETGEQVVPEEILATITTGFSVAKTKGIWPEFGPTVYGMGQQMTSYRGRRLILHGGSVPGFKTQLARFPDDGLGIAVFVNEEVYGTQVHEVLQSTTADVALGLGEIDWSGRHKARVLAALSSTRSPTPRPSHPAEPTEGFAALTGVYRDAGYGSLDLCPLAVPGVDGDSLSDGCRRLLASVDTILPGVVQDGVPTFIAELNRTYATHLVLAHHDGQTFNLSTFASLRPVPPATHFFASASEDTGANPTVAIFEDGGFGVLGGLWGAGEGVEDRQSGSLRERSEVWFNRA